MLIDQRAGMKQEKRSERGNREVAMPEIIPAVANVSRQLRTILIKLNYLSGKSKVLT